jgi:hypothetical protein
VFVKKTVTVEKEHDDNINKDAMKDKYVLMGKREKITEKETSQVTRCRRRRRRGRGKFTAEQDSSGRRVLLR